MVSKDKFPIVIFAYDRTDYLQQVLESLLNQDVNISETRDVHFFQDGSRCLFRNTDTTSNDKIEKSINIFKSCFPNGHVHYDGINRNIALQWRRAEDYIFGDGRYDAAYFFEDDTILAPHYIRMLDHLTAIALESGRVSYVSAFGDHTLSREQQQAVPGAMVAMKHIWATAMMREYWLKERPLLDGYYQIMESHPYSQRPTAEILRRVHQTVGYARGTAQDSIKETASVKLGYARLTTRSCHAKYIGDRGSHFVPESYKAMGFDQTEIYDSPVFDVLFPQAPDLGGIVERERAAIERDSHKLVLHYPQYFDYMAMRCHISVDEKYFLGVDPVSQFVILVSQRDQASVFSMVAWHAGGQTITALKDPTGKFIGLCRNNMILATTAVDQQKIFIVQPAGNGDLYLVDDGGYTFRKALFDDGTAGVLIRGTQRYSLAVKFRLAACD